MTPIISKKICLLGDFSVGKTSLIRRFVERQFSDEYLCTVGVKISQKTVELGSAMQPTLPRVQLLIWDLAGNTRFKSIVPTYLHGSSGAIVVGDISRQVTLDHITNHVELFSSINPKGHIIIALNKIDLLDEIQVARVTDNFSFQQYWQVIDTYATSAKTGSAVDEVFYKLAYQMCHRSAL
jgi:small GTP-binding protein